MNNVHVVAKERHASKRWQRYDSYAHAATDAVAHLVLPEIPRACVVMPIGFIFLLFRFGQILFNLATGKEAHLLGDEAEDALKYSSDDTSTGTQP